MLLPALLWQFVCRAAASGVITTGFDAVAVTGVAAAPVYELLCILAVEWRTLQATAECCATIGWQIIIATDTVLSRLYECHQRECRPCM